MGRFVHLHNHTEFSLFDGLGRPKHYMERVRERGMDALAITDHGCMYGVIPFTQAALAAGIKPIVGIEAYYSAVPVAERVRDSYHFLLLAETELGYRNLLQLVTRSNFEGFYYRPRMDKAMLSEHAQGLIASTACLGGEIPQLLSRDKEQEALHALGELRDIFGPNNLFVELMFHGTDEQRKVNQQLIRLARRSNLPLLATNDCHFVDQADAPIQDALICISTKRLLNDPTRLKQYSDQLYLKSPREMEAIFLAEVPEALSNSVRIADRISWHLTSGASHLPRVETPDNQTPDQYLRSLCQEGLSRLPVAASPDIMGARLDYELTLIAQMGFSSYFIIIWDLCRFAHKQGILMAPGRGSVAGSLVAYLLGITTIDPLKHNLLFERFLNPSRVTMPDIDLDFQDDRREEMIRYVTQKYGRDRVAQIITFNTLKARSAIKDVGRLLGLPSEIYTGLSELVPAKPFAKLSDLNDSPAAQLLLDQEPQLQTVLEMAHRLEGQTRHAGSHAAAVVIADTELVNYLPLQRVKESADSRMSQYDMDTMDFLGLLKIDFLGLTSLQVVQRTCDLIRAYHGIDIDPSAIPLDDPSTFSLFQKGNLRSVFQLEGDACTPVAVAMQPSSFRDVVDLIALVRPGPADLAPMYLRRRQGLEPITYFHPAMAPILESTYGVMIYQEQVMQVSSAIAQYTLSEADDLRRVMAKKKPEEMARHRYQFVHGTITNTSLDPPIDPEQAEKLFDLVDHFSGYGFNLSHSVGYAVLAMQTAYLKYHYPVEFTTAALTAEIGNLDRQTLLLTDAYRRHIPILPPDINASAPTFVPCQTPSGLGIRFALCGIKGITMDTATAIHTFTQRSPIRRISDLSVLMSSDRKITKAIVTILIQAGACDFLASRTDLLAAINRINPRPRTRLIERGQMELFGTDLVPIDDSVPSTPDPGSQITQWEKDLLGFYISDHPLKHLTSVSLPDGLGISYIGDTLGRESLPAEDVAFAVLITDIHPYITRQGTEMAFLTLEDLTGTLDGVVWPRTWDALQRSARAHNTSLQPGIPAILSGHLETRDSKIQLIVSSLYYAGHPGDSSSPVSSQSLPSIAISLPPSSIDPLTFINLIHRYTDPGSSPQPGYVSIIIDISLSVDDPSPFFLGRLINPDSLPSFLSEIDRMTSGSSFVTLSILQTK